VLEAPLPPGLDRPPASLDVSVLLVDDDADTCEGMAVVLRQSGALVRIARSVYEALEIDGTQRIDVLVSDISMPAEMATR
jgi:CheY-like chemotaxis protein